MTISRAPDLARHVRSALIVVDQSLTDSPADVLSPDVVKFINRQLIKFTRLRELTVDVPSAQWIVDKILTALRVANSCPRLQVFDICVGDHIRDWTSLESLLRSQPLLVSLSITAGADYRRDYWDSVNRAPVTFEFANPPTFQLQELSVMMKDVSQSTLPTHQSTSSLQSLNNDVSALHPDSLTISHLSNLHTFSQSSDNRLDGVPNLGIESLPLEHLSLKFPFPSFATDFPTLPPTLMSLSMQETLTAAAVVSLITSDRLKNLTRVTFAPYPYTYWPAGQEPWPRRTWTTFEQAQVARACGSRLRLILPGPSKPHARNQTSTW